MAQRINLLRGFPKKKQDNSLLSPEKMFKLSLVVAVIWTLYFAGTTWHYWHLQKQKASLEDEGVQSQKLIDELEAKYPDEAKKSLETRSQEIEQQIQVKQQLLTLLQSDTLGPDGFTPMLTALSNATIPGVWLTVIEADISQEYFGISGKSESADKVVDFARNLAKQKYFNGIRFNLFQVSNPSKVDPSVSFKMSNQSNRSPEDPTSDEDKTKAKGKKNEQSQP